MIIADFNVKNIIDKTGSSIITNNYSIIRKIESSSLSPRLYELIDQEGKFEDDQLQNRALYSIHCEGLTL